MGKFESVVPNEMSTTQWPLPDGEPSDTHKRAEVLTGDEKVSSGTAVEPTPTPPPFPSPGVIVTTCNVWFMQAPTAAFVLGASSTLLTRCRHRRLPRGENRPRKLDLIMTLCAYYVTCYRVLCDLSCSEVIGCSAWCCALDGKMVGIDRLHEMLES